MTEIDDEIRSLEELANEQIPTAGTAKGRAELICERDHLLDEYLANCGDKKKATIPTIPKLTDLQRRLPTGVLFMAPTLIDDELFLLAAERNRSPEGDSALHPRSRLSRICKLFANASSHS